MIVHDEITIDAPIEAVWAVYSDIERWPTWTASVTSVELLDGATGLDATARARIKQPRFPSLVWSVTALTPGTSWSWVTKRPAATTIATHVLEPLDGDRTRVTQTIDQRGLIGTLVGVLTKGLTRRYLAMEGAGLKGRAEASVPTA